MLREIGGAGQQKLAAARVLIVGVGGLGCPVAQYLAAAGIGHLGLMDHDVVTLGNLQRQIIYTEQDLERPKIQAAGDHLKQLRGDIEIIQHGAAFDNDRADILADYDIIADCTDNFATRFALSDACFHAQRPLVLGAAIGWQGQISTFKPYERDASGTPFPTYRCLVPEEVSREENCETYGVVGPVTGVIGCLQALEIIKLITGAGDTLCGKLLIFDGLSGDMRLVKLNWDRCNPLNGSND